MKKTRQAANVEILNKMYEVVMEYPDMRFGQILTYLELLPKEEHDTPDGVFKTLKDPFYEESAVTLERMRKKV